MSTHGMPVNGRCYARSTVPQRRARMYLEQDGLCFYCEQPMTFRRLRDDPYGTRITTDHLVPLSLGGRHIRLNEVAACYACNHRRGTMCWITFYGVVEIEQAEMGRLVHQTP